MAETHHSTPHHVTSLTTYVVIILALFALTAVTVFAAFTPLPERFAWLHLVIALSIACTKATLVLMYFMHVIHSSRLMTLIIVTSLFFFGIMIAIFLGDYASRSWYPLS